jgi:glucose-6-phosphate isomerase
MPKAEALAQLVQRRPAVPPGPLRMTETMEACGVRLDIAGQRVGADDLKALRDFASAVDVSGAFRSMVRGEMVNLSERRAALHTALRALPDDEPGAPESIRSAVAAELARLRAFATAVRSGTWLGATGRRITDVLNIGIGGSDSGPRLVCHALQELADGPRVHFVSNIDGTVLARLLPRLDPSRTLAIVSSKSCSTRETLLNAAAVRAWFTGAGISGARLSRHMVVVSAKVGAASELGLESDHQFMLWDWVGGRFSVWSAVGLPALLAIGPERFDEYLRGGRAMDRHVLDAPPDRNLAATLALIEVWNRVVLQMPTLCVLAYDERLAPMIGWLQQLAMESLGKSRRADGHLTEFPTGPVVWGGVGTDAQHTFMQLLRQGTARTAVDVLYVDQATHEYAEHHRVLVANARAQVEALTAADPDSLAVNAVSVLSVDRLTPERLGSLLALYEHKVVMVAALLGINPFDQPGVELGKELARKNERDGS